MLLYYITDRSQFPGDENARRSLLLQKIAGASRSGVDFIQLREKDLSARELESLARDAIRVIRENSSLRTENRDPGTALLINSRIDIALAVGGRGVHLRSHDISVGDARKINVATKTVIAVSCHNLDDVAHAVSGGADFAVFGPVFEKQGSAKAQPTGLAELQQACLQTIPVLALGGVNLDNAHACMEAGCAGIAGIRLFQENDIQTVVSRLRGLARTA